MGNKLIISMVYTTLNVKAVRVDCKDITPYLLGSDNCRVHIVASDIDFSQENIVIGGDYGEMIDTSQLICDNTQSIPFVQLRNHG